MGAAQQRSMTVDEFVQWEDGQTEKYEFDGTAPVAMTGGTAAHSAIQRNLLTELANRLRGQPCRPHGSELKIKVAGRIRYPDAFVVCLPVSPRITVVTEPVVVVEIVSESSAIVDLVSTTPSTGRHHRSSVMSSCSRPMSARSCSPATGTRGRAKS